MPVAKLDDAPRCQHTKLNGAPCAAPARRGRNYCVFHDAEHAKQPDSALRMVEDAMSLQYALFQVMRLLTDKAVDTKRAALMLYALQIAASNLKRLHEETQGIANSADTANEKSLMKELLEVLQIPETEAERMAEEMAAEEERENAPCDTFTIKACADDTGEPTTDSKAVSFRARARQETRTRWGWRVRVGASESRNLLLNFDACVMRKPSCSLKPCACSTFVPFGALMPVNAPKNPCYTSNISR